jgi:hypothetical protein
VTAWAVHVVASVDPFATADHLIATCTAFLTGVASVTTAWLAVAQVRKQEKEECASRMEALREDLGHRSEQSGAGGGSGISDRYSPEQQLAGSDTDGDG